MNFTKFWGFDRYVYPSGRVPKTRLYSRSHGLDMGLSKQSYRRWAVVSSAIP